MTVFRYIYRVISSISHMTWLTGSLKMCFSFSGIRASRVPLNFDP